MARIGVSIGTALAAAGERDLDACSGKADQLMYEVKRSRKAGRDSAERADEPQARRRSKRRSVQVLAQRAGHPAVGLRAVLHPRRPAGRLGSGRLRRGERDGHRVRARCDPRRAGAAGAEHPGTARPNAGEHPEPTPDPPGRPVPADRGAPGRSTPRWRLTDDDGRHRHVRRPDGLSPACPTSGASGDLRRGASNPEPVMLYSAGRDGALAPYLDLTDRVGERRTTDASAAASVPSTTIAVRRHAGRLRSRARRVHRRAGRPPGTPPPTASPALPVPARRAGRPGGRPAGRRPSASRGGRGHDLLGATPPGDRPSRCAAAGAAGPRPSS